MRKLIALALLVLAVPASGSALPAHSPGVFRYLSIPVAQGDVVHVSCADTHPRIAFLADSLTDEQGRISGSSSRFTVTGLGTYVDLKAAGTGTTQALTDEDASSGVGGYGLLRAMDTAGTYRAAWASWGDSPLSCTATLNGLPAASKAGDPMKGSYLLSSDFSLGAAAGTSAAAAGVVTMQQEVDGYVFTTISAIAGASTATAPNGELADQTIGMPGGLSVASGLDGTWNYAVAGAEATGVWGATVVIPD